MKPSSKASPGDFGPCCACGRDDRTVRNIVCLDHCAPVPGTGWGCVVCELPGDGALAVLCDRCVRENRPPARVCDGYVGERRRVPLAAVEAMPFAHRRDRHPEDDWVLTPDPERN